MKAVTFTPGDFVRCTRGFEGVIGYVVKTGSTYIVSVVGKSTIEVSGITGRWPACRFETETVEVKR